MLPQVLFAAGMLLHTNFVLLFLLMAADNLLRYFWLPAASCQLQWQQPFNLPDSSIIVFLSGLTSRFKMYGAHDNVLATRYGMVALLCRQTKSIAAVPQKLALIWFSCYR